MLKFTVQDNFTEAMARALSKAGDKVSHIVAIQAAKDTTPYVPMLTGSLNTRTQIVGDTIIYPGPYAKYLYYGKLEIDPETGSAWARKGTKKVETDRDLVFTTDFHPDAQAHWFEASKAQNMEKWERVAEKAVEHELDE